MAAYFQLLRLDTNEATPFTVIDQELCQNLGTPYDDRRYTMGWYDTIGFSLAMGKSFPEITDHLRSMSESGDNEERDYYRTMVRINHYLMEHYRSSSWHGR